jgi:hypothetical protein
VGADQLILDISDEERLAPTAALRMSNAFSSWHVRIRPDLIAACSIGSCCN